MFRLSLQRLLSLSPGGRGPCIMQSVRGIQTPRKLEGKVALVTASSEGIGLAVARRLAQDGARVVVSSRKQQNVDRAVEELRKEGLDVEGMVCHVGKKDDREKLVNTAVQKFGGVDILVSNAAVNPFFGNIMDSTDEVWEKNEPAHIEWFGRHSNVYVSPGQFIIGEIVDLTCLILDYQTYYLRDELLLGMSDSSLLIKKEALNRKLRLTEHAEMSPAKPSFSRWPSNVYGGL